MRLPNGYGSVYKLSGNRRKPFIARKTIGWDENGKQVYATIGYYQSKPEALQALAAFNDNPYDLQMSKTTFADIYQRWYKDEFTDDSNKSTKRNYVSAYKRCGKLYKMKMSDIRPYHLQEVLDSYTNMSYESVHRIRVLFNKLYRWCMNHDCIKKNYAENLKVNVKYESAEQRTSFTSEEIKLIWQNASQNEYAPMVLILIYSGVRIMELLDLKKEDVHLEERYFNVRASKTEAGIRVVPIADKVLSFWKSFIEKSKCDYAFTNLKGEKFSYDNFKNRYWQPFMEQLNFKHTIHETRHTCISQLTMKNANPTIIKKIVGHKSVMSLTEKVYTHIEIQELVNTINLIP